MRKHGFKHDGEMALAYLAQLPPVRFMPTYKGRALFARPKRGSWKVIDDMPQCIAEFKTLRARMKWDGVLVILPSHEWRRYRLEQTFTELPKGSVLKPMWSFLSRDVAGIFLVSRRMGGRPTE